MKNICFLLLTVSLLIAGCSNSDEFDPKTCDDYQIGIILPGQVQHLKPLVDLKKDMKKEGRDVEVINLSQIEIWVLSVDLSKYLLDEDLNGKYIELNSDNLYSVKIILNQGQCEQVVKFKDPIRVNFCNEEIQNFGKFPEGMFEPELEEEKVEKDENTKMI